MEPKLPSPQKIVEELQSLGWSHSRIAEEAGSSQPNISRIADGQDCKSKLYRRLIKVRSGVKGKAVKTCARTFVTNASKKGAADGSAQD